MGRVSVTCGADNSNNLPLKSNAVKAEKHEKLATLSLHTEQTLTLESVIRPFIVATSLCLLLDYSTSTSPSELVTKKLLLLFLYRY